MKLLKTLLIAAAAFMSLPCFAALELRQPCASGMVLQQNTDATLWGHADAGAEVTVTPSWSGRKYSVKADENGVWRTKVATPAASYTAYTIKVKSGKESLVLEDVLIGEVWFAGGQSNMEMPVRGFHNCPVEGYMDAVCQAPVHDRIRMYTERRRQSYTPEPDPQGEWAKADCNTVPNMSATAYFFARELNRMLDVPVGIICCAYGGTRVESWLPEATVASYGTEDLSHEAIEAMTHWERPFKMYNSMIYPIQGWTVKGFIWYQGCSNVGRHQTFVPRMEELIRLFRSHFGDEGSALPFYMCEIAPYQYGSADQIGVSPLLRAAQHQVAAETDNCEIIVTNDLVYPYEFRNIHPCRKQPVGERLARMALGRDYGFGSIYNGYPHAVRVYRDHNQPKLLFVEFDNCPEGIGRLDGIETLEVTNGDGTWHARTSCSFNVGKKLMTIDVSDLIAVTCTGNCANCVNAKGETWAVRYGWGDFRPGNLFNNQGLPFVPFCISE